MEQIGDNRKYDGVKYDDSNDAVFLSDRIHPLSKDTKFQQRKEINPLKKKETVQEIGTVSGFKAKWKLEDVVDAKAVFLSDDSYYKQRTAMITNSEGTVQAKLGPTEIGKIDDFKKPEWSEQIEQELKANDNIFADKIKKENKDYAELAKLEHKKGAVEVGTIKDYDSIDYRLTKDDLMGGFLKERAWYDSSAVSELFDEGISHLLKSLPSHKLRVMDHVPLPSGFQVHRFIYF